jgi:hypothetical protein
MPGFQPLGSYQLTLHNLAPELERPPPAAAPADFLARRPAEPRATGESSGCDRPPGGRGAPRSGS